MAGVGPSVASSAASTEPPSRQFLLSIRRLLLLPRRRASSSPPPLDRRRHAMAGVGPSVASSAAEAAAVSAGGATSFRVGMVRIVSFLVGGLNFAVLLLGLYLVDAVLPPSCGGGLALAAVPAMAGVRVLAMLGTHAGPARHGGCHCSPPPPGGRRFRGRRHRSPPRDQNKVAGFLDKAGAYAIVSSTPCSPEYTEIETYKTSKLFW